MAARYEILSEETYKNWLTPEEAILELSPLDPNTAAIQLLEAMRSLRVHTAAETIFCQPRYLPAETLGSYTVIPYFYWDFLSGQAQKLNFWKTGLARMWFGTTQHFP